MHNNCYTLITGASEGLGKALAIECAGRNMNLILVALPGPRAVFPGQPDKRQLSCTGHLHWQRSVQG